MTRSTQNIMYTIIFIIVCVCFYLIRPTFDFVPHGVLLPASNQTYQAVPVTSVRAYKHYPLQFAKVGLIRAQMHYGNTNRKNLQNILNKVGRFVVTTAAAHGANGVIFTTQGYSGSAISPLDGAVIYAEAIRTQK